MYSYAGKILQVDLTGQKYQEISLDPEIARDYLGGFGLALRMLADFGKSGVDPFSPENLIVFAAGLLSGTIMPGSSRITAATKFPQTGAIGGASGSMHFAATLKYAGYDAIVVKGRAKRPVYLLVENGAPSCLDASELWGRDIPDVNDYLKAKHGPEQTSVICIGQAGENLVRLSLARVDKTASLGKGGLGAVMGSKNLKAVVVRGDGSIKVADGTSFLRLIDRLLERMKKWPLRERVVNLGMMHGWPNILQEGFYWKDRSEVYPREVGDKNWGVEEYLKVKAGRYACLACPIADKELLQCPAEPETLSYASGFYGQNVHWGARGGVQKASEVVKCINAVNRYGLDAHSASLLIDHVVALQEKGLIDTGRSLPRGFATTITLIEEISLRKPGLGEIMAEGLAGLRRAFGDVVLEGAVTEKGMEVLYDPRLTGMGTMEFETVVNPRGGHHSSGGSPAYSQGASLEKFRSHCHRMGIPEEAINRILADPSEVNMPRLTRYAEDWYALLSSLGLCVRAHLNRFYSLANCAELVTAATGSPFTPEELAQVGERAWNLLKVLNVKEGFSRKDDCFPEKWQEPLMDGDKNLRLRNYFATRELNRGDFEKMLTDYYDERGWDHESGTPSLELIKQLKIKVK